MYEASLLRSREALTVSSLYNVGEQFGVGWTKTGLHDDYTCNLVGHDDSIMETEDVMRSNGEESVIVEVAKELATLGERQDKIWGGISPFEYNQRDSPDVIIGRLMADLVSEDWKVNHKRNRNCNLIFCCHSFFHCFTFFLIRNKSKLLK